MKTALHVAALLVLLAGPVYALPKEASVDVVKTKYKNLFVMKVDRAFKGAEVEVYYSNGDLVTSQKLKRRKVIIDFCDTRFGTYTIKVKNGTEVLDFHYVKK